MADPTSDAIWEGRRMKLLPPDMVKVSDEAQEVLFAPHANVVAPSVLMPQGVMGTSLLFSSVGCQHSM